MEEREAGAGAWWRADWERAGLRAPGAATEDLVRWRGDSRPTSTREERDLARWIDSRVGGGMALPAPALCLVNSLRWRWGETEGVTS